MDSQYAMVLYSKSLSLEPITNERSEDTIQRLKDSGFLGDYFSKQFFDEKKQEVKKTGYLIGENFL